jgi:hypothetical protein
MYIADEALQPPQYALKIYPQWMFFGKPNYLNIKDSANTYILDASYH